MERIDAWRRAVLAAALIAMLVGAPAWADGEEAGEEDAVEVPEPLPPEEAARLEKLLTKAAKRRDASDVLPVLDELGDRSDPRFVKPLVKMLKHGSSTVAVRAAQALYAQYLAEEKERAKLARDLWKTGWDDRANQRRYEVQARTLIAYAKQAGGGPIDDGHFKEVERLWRRIIGDPDPSYAPALVAICEYVRLTKDKRLCRLLAEEIDEPMSTAPDSPTNPPAAWWEKRWKLWKPVKAEVVETLEDLTEQSFKDTASAKAWFEANVETFGFKW